MNEKEQKEVVGMTNKQLQGILELLKIIEAEAPEKMKDALEKVQDILSD